MNRETLRKEFEKEGFTKSNPMEDLNTYAVWLENKLIYFTDGSSNVLETYEKLLKISKSIDKKCRTIETRVSFL